MVGPAPEGNLAKSKGSGKGKRKTITRSIRAMPVLCLFRRDALPMDPARFAGGFLLNVLSCPVLAWALPGLGAA